MDEKLDQSSLKVEHPTTGQDVSGYDNPWAVESVEDFLHYCCPECDVKSQSRDMFLDHALLNHPMVRQYN